ncbi:MAG: cold shock domain-containing protein [Fermentimonas sp.]|jgi:cold shock CspA family protein
MSKSSYSKRAIAKKKEQKRKEKRKRREERRAEAPSTFSEMIAYVDEFGVITDTPPEPQVEEVDLESIEISTPKMDAQVEDELKGHVNFFNQSRGYGFIGDLSSGNEYFFHISNAPEDITEGDLVTFDLERGDKGINAINVTILSKA